MAVLQGSIHKSWGKKNLQRLCLGVTRWIRRATDALAKATLPERFRRRRPAEEEEIQEEGAIGDVHLPIRVRVGTVHTRGRYPLGEQIAQGENRIGDVALSITVSVSTPELWCLRRWVLVTVFVGSTVNASPTGSGIAGHISFRSPFRGT